MSTIKKIAEITGVSIGTVDRALHNRGRVSEKTREKILNAAKDTGYKTNFFARNLKLSKVYKFCVFMPDPGCDSNYWEIPFEGINKAVKELSHYRIAVEFIFYNKYSEKSIIKGFAALGKKHFDGLIIAPTGGTVFNNLIKKIPKETPYIFFDSLLPESSYISFIGQDAYTSGLTGAKLMHLLLGSDSGVLLVNYVPEDYHIIQRKNGFCDYFKSVNHTKINMIDVPPDYGRNTRELLDKILMEKGSETKGIFVTNASTYLVAKYLKRKKLSGEIKLIGYDLINENISFLKEGIIDFIVSQMSERQGYESVYTLANLVILKQKVEKHKLMQIDIITKENVDYYQS